MARTKGKGRKKTGKFLQPNKTQEFKQMHHLGSDLKSGNPRLDIVLVAGSGEASLPTCPYKIPLSSQTVPIRKRKKKIWIHYLDRKKLAALSNHFNPIPFVREKPSHFATHRLLLSRLGLWNFLHLDFCQNIHSDLIKQLIVCYNPKKPIFRRSQVNGWPVEVTRAMLARALCLPPKRLNLDAASTGPLVVSEEEAVFMEELVSSWLVLQDDGCELPAEVLKVKFLIKEKRVEEVDWTDLIWFMVRRELLKGAKLVNCHYASHLQRLLMNQKPRLFLNRVEIVKGWEKHRILGVGDNSLAVRESKSERKTESLSTQEERCSKLRNSSFEQCEEKKLSVDFEWNNKNECQWDLADLEFGGSSDTLLTNGHCNDERLKMDLDTGHDNGEKEFALDDLVENCKSILYNLDEVKMESGNKELNFLPDELVSAELQHEGAANEQSEFGTKNCDYIGSQEKEVNNNDSEGAGQTDSANDMLVNEKSREGSSNLSTSEIPHHDGMQETNFHQMNLVVTKYGLNVLAEYQNAIETSTSDDQHAIKDENMKMIKYDIAAYQNAIDGETITSSDQHAIETEEDGNRKVLQNEIPEGSIEDEQINGKADEVLESEEKKFPFCTTVFQGDYNCKEHETKMMRDGDYEKEFSQEVLFHDDQICFNAAKEKPEQLCTGKPEANGSNEIRLKSSSFAVVQQEIDCWNVTKSAAADDEDDEDEESYALDLCSNQVQIWMSRLKNAVENQMKNGKENEMLVKELETKNKMLQDSEKKRWEEKQRYQKSMGRLEREVFFMKNILEEYRKALFEVDKSFAEYRRKRTQQEGEVPAYVDHPDGGGNVVLTKELIEDFKHLNPASLQN